MNVETGEIKRYTNEELKESLKSEPLVSVEEKDMTKK